MKNITQKMVRFILAPKARLKKLLLLTLLVGLMGTFSNCRKDFVDDMMRIANTKSHGDGGGTKGDGRDSTNNGKGRGKDPGGQKDSTRGGNGIDTTGRH